MFKKRFSYVASVRVTGVDLKLRAHTLPEKMHVKTGSIYVYMGNARQW